MLVIAGEIHDPWPPLLTTLSSTHTMTLSGRERGLIKYLLPLVLISVEFPEIGADAWDVLFFGVAKEKSSKKLISNKPCVNPLLASRKKKKNKENFVFNETNMSRQLTVIFQHRNVCLII